jgi:hypothetical protein
MSMCVCGGGGTINKLLCLVAPDIAEFKLLKVIKGGGPEPGLHCCFCATVSCEDVEAASTDLVEGEDAQDNMI